MNCDILQFIPRLLLAEQATTRRPSDAGTLPQTRINDCCHHDRSLLVSLTTRTDAFYLLAIVDKFLTDKLI